MASLTITALYSKKILLGLSIFLGSLLLILIIFTFSKSIFEMVFPPKPDPALVAFGKLPELPLTEGKRPPKNVTYKIETVSGELKELKTILKVFAIDLSSAPKFGDLSSANTKAQKTRFALPPASVIDEVATYTDQANKSRILTINTISGDMSLNTDYLNNTEVISSQIKNDEGAKSTAQTFLSTFGLNPGAYPKEKITTARYKIDGGKLAEAIPGSSTNLIQVVFNRADLDTIPVVYSSFDKPKVTALVSAAGVVSVKATLAKIQEYRFSTYPLKGINKAFADLQAGKVIYNKELGGSEFAIRDVSLAYLDTDSEQAFLEPVYVFSSDDGLAAYVSAVSDAWINTKSN